MIESKYYLNSLVIIIVVLLAIKSSAFDDDDDAHWHDHDPPTNDDNNILDHNKSNKLPLPKDKILFKDVKTLVFQRHKRTTARRTHSMPQLSCVGGTAGCKLFTPDEVHCDMLNYNHKDKSKIEWSCRADMTDKVRFNHVDVICEGYEYPEDDYILLGSCGLEFTLDHTDPHDYHEKSYYKHMDEDEKEMHRKKIKLQQSEHQASKKPAGMRLTPNSGTKSDNWFSFVTSMDSNQLIYIVAILITLALLILIKSAYFNKPVIGGANTMGWSHSKRTTSSLLQRPLSYGPLASAVLSTKKAC